ncbi:MAG: hypothetical protein V4631_00150 [Pseudomonadota bacterium]
MQTHKPFPDPLMARSLTDEADIGSGEKTPGQLETEQMIREIPALPPQDERDDGDEAGSEASGQNRERREHDASLERDEPSGDLDSLDPVPPKGH